MNQDLGRFLMKRFARRKRPISCLLALLAVPSAVNLTSCSGSGDKNVQAGGPAVTVGVTKVVKKSLGREITLSSELVPFQEIDVYAKESGYIKKLLVDYGTHVKAGQIMAILEIPELEAQLQEDQADITNANNQVSRAQHELARCISSTRALTMSFRASLESLRSRKSTMRREKT
jgi:multidrug efflux pump subunit AcrA (membrane-fusion protein)